ncbi:MAG: thiamine pyrophosphate-dependent dehydrogenase E1 component subunit alpha [Pseudomonadota bacterium]
MTRELAPSLGLLRRMMLIRSFETALMRRPDHGFQLLSSGQEAVAVGVCAALGADDQLVCSGRSIGPALARGLDPREVMAELLGKSSGTNAGRGGRGHIAQPELGFFGAHAVVGGNLTIAAGVALAFKTSRKPGVVACLFGDGACGSGALHETLNLATLWQLPLVLVCDNNGYSVSTSTGDGLAPKRLADFALPFGIPAQTVDGMEVGRVLDAAASMVAHARGGGGPSLLECRSERFHPHSTASRETRPADEVTAARARCPIEALTRRLLATGAAEAGAIARLRDEVESTVDVSLAFADASSYPSPEELQSDGDI